ncbi:MAG: TIR domain-containing protein [Sciscionella sp.]
MTNAPGAGGLHPEQLAAHVAGQRYDVFLSFTWADVAQVEPIEAALKEQGLRVFRDSECIEEFDGITAELVRALASSAVLLAYYSLRYPTRHACQWELTAAFIAAQREGDPRRRVLAVNPEHNSDHLAPVELEDARYHVAPRTAQERAALAGRVLERVRAVSGPLGSVRARVDPSRMPERLRRPRCFVGRYPQLWQIHSALRAKDLPATCPPTSSSVAVVTGLAGTGKTSVVEQYAVLFRDAFPGGIFWTGLFDGGPGLNAEETLAQFFVQMRRIAHHVLGHDMTGVTPEVLGTMLARHFTAEGHDVLWIVDDVPSGLHPEVLNQLLIPSPLVRTVLTSRAGTPHWPTPRIELGGLTAQEASALFAVTRAPVDESEKQAIDRLALRCGGHPMVIQQTADAVRDRQGIVTAAEFAGYLDAASSSVLEVLRADVERLGEPARQVLRLAAVLSSAPFPPHLVVDVLGLVLTVPSEQVNRVVGDAMCELADRRLAQQVDLAAPGRPGRSWQVHPLVGVAVRQPGDAVQIAEIARRAARLVVALLTVGAEEPDLTDPAMAHLHQHARALAERAETPVAQRVALLRAVSHWYTRQGDVAAARLVAREALTLAPDSVEDLLTAAGTSIAAGGYQEAAGYCLRVVQLAERNGNYRAEYRARFLAAQAYDNLSRYSDADAIFYSGVDARHHAQPPGWMPDGEQWGVQVQRVIGLRLRGKLTAALQVLESVLPLMPSASAADAVTEPLPTAKLELTRLQLQQGRIRAARQTAADVVTAYQRLGIDSHPACLDAIGLQAEADMTVDLTEMHLDTGQWDRRQAELGEAYDSYRRTLGEDNPRTLAARLQRDLALVSRGRPKQALGALADTERALARVLGETHPLRYRACYAMTLAHAQLRDHPRQLAILQELLSSEVKSLGPYHPDTITTHLDVGIVLALTGQLELGRRYANEAVHHIGDELSWRTGLRTRAKISQLLMHLPKFLWEGAVLLDRLFGSKKTE